MTVFLFATVFYMATVAIFPSDVLNAASDSLSTCIKVVIPSLFPFMVGSRLLIKLGLCELLSRWLSPLTKHLFGMNGNASIAILMGLIGGFPVGASVTAELYRNHKIDRESAERLLGYTNNAGPLFILGTVASGLMGTPEMGITLYLAQLFSALLIGMLFAPGSLSNENHPKQISDSSDESFGALLSDAVDQSVTVLFNISGFIMLFGVLIRILGKLPFPTLWFSMFLEITNGTAIVASMSQVPKALQSALLSAVIGWSGFSVHMQVLSVIKGLSLRTMYYWLGKVLQMVFAFLFGLSFALYDSKKVYLFFLILAGTIYFAKHIPMKKSRRKSPALQRQF